MRPGHRGCVPGNLIITVHGHPFIPVIQSGPLKRLFVQLKSQGFDEMEPGLGGNAGPADILYWRASQALIIQCSSWLCHAFPSRRLTKRWMRPRASFRLFRNKHRNPYKTTPQSPNAVPGTTATFSSCKSLVQTPRMSSQNV